jgi:hypothetical protein
MRAYAVHLVLRWTNAAGTGAMPVAVTRIS